MVSGQAEQVDMDDTTLWMSNKYQRIINDTKGQNTKISDIIQHNTFVGRHRLKPSDWRNYENDKKTMHRRTGSIY